MHFSTRRLTLAALACSLVATSSYAQEANWTGSVSNNFLDGQNWSNGTGPISDSTENYIRDGFATLNSSQPVSLGSGHLNVGVEGFATLELLGNASLNLGTLNVGLENGNGEVRIFNGILGVNTLNIGVGDTGSGGGSFGSQVELIGGILNTGDVHIGGTGESVLRIIDSRSVFLNGQVSVGTTSLGSYNFARGEMYIGGTNIGTRARIGQLFIGNEGLVTVDGGSVIESLGGQIQLEGGVIQFGTGGETIGATDATITNLFGSTSVGAVRFNHSNAALTPNDISIGDYVTIQQVGSGRTILNDHYLGSTAQIDGGILQLGVGATTFGNAGVVEGDILNNATLEINRGDTYVYTSDIGGTGQTVITQGRLQIGDGGTEGSILQDVQNNDELAFNRSDTLVVVGDITGSGKTFVQGTGRLQVGNGGEAGSIQQDVENNSELAFFNSNDVVFSDVISGSGDLYKLGINTLELSAINTYSGITVINGGALNISGELTAGGAITINQDGSLIGTGLVNRDVVIAGGTLGTGLTILGAVTTGDQVSVGDVVIGEDVVAQAGQQVIVNNATGGSIDVTLGTATIDVLDGANLTTGAWGALIDSMTSGTVNVSNNGSATFNSLTGGSISMNNANLKVQSGTFNGEITGSGEVRKTGSGIFTLNAPNTGYVGTFRATQGTLVIAADGALGGFPLVIVDGDAVLQVNEGVSLASGTIDLTPGTGPAGPSVEKTFNDENVGDIGTITSGGTSTQFLGGEVNATVNYSFTTVDNALTLGNEMAISGLNGTAFGLLMESDRLPADGNPENYFLGWLNTATGERVLATEGNIGPDGVLAGYHNMTIQEFVVGNGGWNPGDMLGAYGSDLEAGQVWAIFDHNSKFSIQAVPEPNTMFALSVGAVLLLRRRRRDRD